MTYTRTFSKWGAAALLSGSLFAAGTGLSTEPVAAASPSSITNPQAVDTLHEIYKSAFNGEMPHLPKDFIISEDKRKDVRATFGQPSGNSSFDVYPAEMGHPGYAFAYKKDGTISQIRYFGTNVERQMNLGSITPKVLGKEIGSADLIRTVPGTHERDYIYHTGEYELHFIVGDDQTVNHINLKEKK